MLPTGPSTRSPSTPISATTTPSDLRPVIDPLNRRVYEERQQRRLPRSGFASSQDRTRRPSSPLFHTLDELDERLEDRRYLFGDEQTLADWRLFTTLLRFDAVYYSHFKFSPCARIVDYPNLSAHLRDLYQLPRDRRHRAHRRTSSRHYYVHAHR